VSWCLCLCLFGSGCWFGLGLCLLGLFGRFCVGWVLVRVMVWLGGRVIFSRGLCGFFGRRVFCWLVGVLFGVVFICRLRVAWSCFCWCGLFLLQVRLL